MRDLAIAYGNNRQAKKWVNKTIKYDDLKNRLKVTIRTTESAEEYKKMSKAQRDAAKDHGGFVGGVLKGGRRKIDTVEKRSMIALDGDRIDKAFLDDYENIAPYTSCLYTTHSSTAEEPRVRLVFPLTRDITSEEFVAVSRYIAQMLGIDYFDECSYQPNQLMYWPSSPQNGVFVFKEVDKAWLNPDDILSAHPEWIDPTQLPTSSRESKANQVAQQKVQDPLTKEGTVGLFNRAYFPVTKALDAFLSDVYEATDNENRYHLIESHSMVGVEIKDGKFVYSHHAKNPAYLKALANAEEDAFLNGDGKGKPTGIFDATAGGQIAGTLTAAIKSDDLIDLVYGLKKPYRKKASFIMNDATLASLRKLKDNNGAYIWQPSYKEGEPDRVLGYAVHTSSFAPTNAISFGDYSYYNIGDRGSRSFAELRELFAGNGMVGYVAKERVDGKLILPEVVKVLKLKEDTATTSTTKG